MIDLDEVERQYSLLPIVPLLIAELKAARKTIIAAESFLYEVMNGSEDRFVIKSMLKFEEAFNELKGGDNWPTVSQRDEINEKVVRDDDLD